MIVAENIVIDGRELIRTYSDEGRYVVRDGVQYSEAIDPIDTVREYTEGDIMPDDIKNSHTIESDEATEADYKAALGEFGVEI